MKKIKEETVHSFEISLNDEEVGMIALALDYYNAKSGGGGVQTSMLRDLLDEFRKLDRNEER